MATAINLDSELLKRNRAVLTDTISRFAKIDMNAAGKYFDVFAGYDNVEVAKMFSDFFFERSMQFKEISKLEKKVKEFDDFVLSLADGPWVNGDFSYREPGIYESFYEESAKLRTHLDKNSFALYMEYLMQGFLRYRENTEGSFHMQSLFDILEHAKQNIKSKRELEIYGNRLKLVSSFFLDGMLFQEQLEKAVQTEKKSALIAVEFLHNTSENTRNAILLDLKEWYDGELYKRIGTLVPDKKFAQYLAVDKIKFWTYRGETQFISQTIDSITSAHSAASILNNLDAFITDENNERLYEICLSYEFAGIILSSYFSKQLHSSSNKKDAMLKIGEYMVSDRKKLQKAVTKISSMKDSALEWVTVKQTFDESDIDRIIDYEEKTTVTSAPIILGSTTPGKKELPKSYRSIISRIEREGEEFTHVSIEFQNAYKKILKDYTSRIDEMWKEFGNDPSIAAFYHIAMNINAISAEKHGETVVRQIMNSDKYFESFVSNFSTIAPKLTALAKKELKNYKVEIEKILFPAYS